jgi:hypothetical protein
MSTRQTAEQKIVLGGKVVKKRFKLATRSLVAVLLASSLFVLGYALFAESGTDVLVGAGKNQQLLGETHTGIEATEGVAAANAAEIDEVTLNLFAAVDYSPIAIAMTFNGSPKTNRAFAWYTRYDDPQNAPADAKDSIVEIVTADKDFDAADVQRYIGKPDETKVLNLKITNSTNGTFISHKVLVEGLIPGTAYKYRVGSADNWSNTGAFTTEAETEANYEFLYMTDSQGSNSQDYEVFANTLRQGLQYFPDSKFMVMTGDEVDAGSLESQWLDYFGKPQDMFLKLPIMAAVGNHEGPYNDNYYHHFHYPNDSISNPLPPGSVYSYDYGDAHFMILNTMDMAWDERQKESFRQQIEWLRKEVAETDKKWKIVGFHKAIYSLANHALDADILELRQMLYPVFDELGIDVVLQGHDHTYMRSYQMYNNKKVAGVQTDEQGNALNPDGTLYMINNSAGTKYYNVRNDVDNFFAVVSEQPKVPIFSGIQMTENSFTIKSYRSGEQTPFDTYTIVREDSKPDPVEQLAAGKTGDGKVLLSWKQPKAANADDAIRGFRIYEADGKLGMNWSAFVPAVKGQESYSYTVAGAASGEEYELVVKAVDKRDNSSASNVSTAGIVPAAPTAPKVDDGHNTFGWTNVPGYAELSDYEYSVDSGMNWQPATANPQPVGSHDYAAGLVQVRIKAETAASVEPGTPLRSDKPFTVNRIQDTYQISGELKRGKQLQVDVALDKLAAYDGAAYVVFQLMDGDMPTLINAVPLQQSQLKFTQYFAAEGSNYTVRVFVVDKFSIELRTPTQLARPIDFK